MKLREKRYQTKVNSVRVKPKLQGAKRVTKYLAIITLLVGGVFVTSSQETLKAAACATPASDMGTDTLPLNVPTAGDYTIWTRMIAPDTTNNSINLQVDASTCYDVGGGSFVATSWTADGANWVNYANGTSSTPVRLTLTAGDHTLKYVGTKAGVQIDKIFVTADTAKMPTGTCDDCLAGNSTGDSTPPTVSLVKPTAGQVLTGSNQLSATAADNSGSVAKVEFLVDGVVVNTATASPFNFNWLSSSVANGPHKLTAKAYDPTGNSTTSAEVSVTTNNLNVCANNPAPPANLRTSGSTATEITLVWDAAVPAADCQIKEYNVYRDATLVGTTKDTTYKDQGLTPGATLSYTVEAVDSAKHISAKSAAVPGTTSNDSTAPSVPTGLQKSLVNSSSVALSWNPSTDTNGVASYDIYRDGTKINSSPSNSFTDSTVQPKTQYTYTVLAKDTAGNPSGQSQPVTVTTLDGPATAAGNKLYIAPATGNYAVGQTLTVEIREDSGTTGVSSAGADVSYPTNLEYVSADANGDFSGGCPIKPDPAKPAANPVGNVVSFVCFLPVATGDVAPTLTGDKLIARVTFKVLSAGTAKIDFKQGTDNTGVYNAGINVVQAYQSANYTLAAPVTPTTAPPANSPPAPATAPTPTPAPAPAPSPAPRPAPRPTAPSTSSGSGAATPKPSTTVPATTTTIAPQGNAQPVTLPNNTTVELSDPVVVQTVPGSSQNVTKVEYYLNGKLIAAIKTPPYSYTVKTDNMKNGTYKLTTKTYYEDGTVDTKDASLVVKNPMSFRQIMLQLGGLVWLIILLLIVAAAGVWFIFFRKPSGGGDGYDGGDGYMFGPNNMGPPPTDPMAGGGPTYGPPAPGAGPYGTELKLDLSRY